MKKMVFAALAAFLSISQAGAAVIDLPTGSNGVYDGSFKVTHDSAFTDKLIISSNNYGYFDFFAFANATGDLGIDFTSATANGVVLNVDKHGVSTPANTYLTGPVTVTLTGNSGRAGFYVTLVKFFPAVAPTAPAVPEPSTWMMMIFGFGAIGFAIRRKTVLRFV